jgi:endonuclease/exonuclease/phosphatase family metal-dependent hydrolase
MRITSTIQKQAEQARLLVEHSNSDPYKTIISADFNNTQYSYPYHLIKGDRQDSFLEKGVGFGRTYKSVGMPFRIDFILADPEFEVRAHKNYAIRLSDHFPIMASFRLKKE